MTVERSLLQPSLSLSLSLSNPTSQQCQNVLEQGFDLSDLPICWMIPPPSQTPLTFPYRESITEGPHFPPGGGGGRKERSCKFQTYFQSIISNNRERGRVRKGQKSLCVCVRNPPMMSPGRAGPGWRPPNLPKKRENPLGGGHLATQGRQQGHPGRLSQLGAEFGANRPLGARPGRRASSSLRQGPPPLGRLIKPKTFFTFSFFLFLSSFVWFLSL